MEESGWEEQPLKASLLPLPPLHGMVVDTDRRRFILPGNIFNGMTGAVGHLHQRLYRLDFSVLGSRGCAHETPGFDLGQGVH